MPHGPNVEPKCHPCNGHCYQGRRCPDRAQARLDLREVVVRVSGLLRRPKPDLGRDRPMAR
jgi:hypothetical protein